ncbi:MAG: PP2C family protein-serine/threonine phosphatase [Muribaculaceae bacterium]
MKIKPGKALSFSQLGQRGNQEDSRWPDADTAGDGQRFFIVCDGVGGSSHGEDASFIVADTMARALVGRDWNRPFVRHDLDEALDAVYERLNREAGPDNSDMATTMAFVAFHGGGCLAAHIGDSRIYHIRPNVGVLYRSEDHSLVNAMVHSGAITPEEALTHPRRNVVTRCITPTRHTDERSRPTVTQLSELLDGDYIFMCSDGVLENISDSRLTEILSAETDDGQKMQTIRDICSQSRDNNTAWLIPVVKDEATEASGRKNNFFRNLFR